MRTSVSGLARHEERSFVNVPRRSRHNDKKKAKRSIAIASSTLLVAVGAVLGYAAQWSRLEQTIESPNLDVRATAGAQAPIAYDRDLDRLVSVEEYLGHSMYRHDDIRKRVESSTMTDTAKATITDRLQRYFAKEAWCVAQIASKEPVGDGQMKRDLKAFNALIQANCDLFDPKIPLEFRPGA